MPTSDDPLDDAAPGSDAVLALVYDELRRIARAKLDKERVGHTLQPTALVHEAYVKLAERTQAQFADRAAFLAASARAMREILVDHARARATAKRGGDAARVTLSESIVGSDGTDVDLLVFDDALRALAKLDARKARMVELRFFGGLTIEETARALGVSTMTVSTDWRVARAWLASELGDG